MTYVSTINFFNFSICLALIPLYMNYELGLNYIHCIFVEKWVCFFIAANINSSSIVAAASLVARSLYFLAGGKDPSAITSIKVNTSLVEELLGCLLDCEPGLSCELVKHYITPATTCPNHYVGVILRETSAPHYPDYAGDISRFVWNFLADKTALLSKNVTSLCPNNCNGDGELCIRQETTAAKGVCVISTTR